MTGRLQSICTRRAASLWNQSISRNTGIIGAIAKTKIGTVKKTPTAKRRLKSWSCGSGSSPVKSGFRSSAMPHFGQMPGESLSTPGHIGQKYFAEDAGVTVSLPWQQQGLFFKAG